MEKQGILFNLGWAEKRNMEIVFLTRKRKDKIKYINWIELKVSLKTVKKKQWQAVQKRSNQGVSHDPGTDVCFHGKKSNPENGLYNLHDVTCWSGEREGRQLQRERGSPTSERGYSNRLEEVVWNPSPLNNGHRKSPNEMVD